MPASTKVFYTVLKAFKEQDPNGNSIADEIPWAPMGFGDNPGLMNMFCPFGVVDSMMELWLSVTNGKVQYIAAQEGFKASISHTHRLYAEGLLDQEVFSNTDWGGVVCKNQSSSRFSGDCRRIRYLGP
jgi:putative aldouronate transport system substrate-binding protein